MATPLLKYLIVSPSTGAVSSIVDTSTGTALNLTCTAVTGTSIGAGVGATFGATSGAVSARLNGTKVATALAGITAATWEFVADTTSDNGFMELVGFQDAAGTNDIFSVLTGSAGIGQVGIAGAGGTAAWFDVTPGLHHFMAVQDNTQATAANRLKLYVDGVLASVNATPFAPTYPTLSQAIDSGFTNYANNVITIGCLAAASIQFFLGSNYAAFLYASALTSGDASSHSTALLANNDADPNSGAVTIPFRRRPFDLSAWDDPDPAPPRRRVSPVAMPAAPTRIPFRRQVLDWSQFYEPALYWQGTRSALVQPPPPPGFTRPWLFAAAASWEPEPTMLVRSRTRPPPAAAPLPPLGPHGNRAWLTAALDSWTPEDITPRRLLRFPPPVVVAPAVNVPFSRQWVTLALDSWTPEVTMSARRLAYPPPVAPNPPAPPVPPPTQPTNTGPFDWRADYAAIIGQMFRGGGYPHQV